jgi:hypothetical protein
MSTDAKASYNLFDSYAFKHVKSLYISTFNPTTAFKGKYSNYLLGRLCRTFS